MFRFITFTVAVSLLAAMAACGPNKKRNRGLEEAKKQSLKGTGQLEEIMVGNDLPHLADGKATFKTSCANPVNLQLTASEKELTKDFLSDGAVYELVSVRLHGEARLKGGETGMISGTVTGPLQVTDKRTDLDNVAQVTCHTSQAGTVKGKSVAPAEIVLDVPAQISSGKTTAGAITILQARKGKTAGRVTILPEVKVSADELLKAPTDQNIKALLSTDTDKQIHFRIQRKSSGPDGETFVWTQEAIYKRK